MTRLPRPVALYFAAANARDSHAAAACFADGAVVQDEGRERQGIRAIEEWVEETTRKYQPTAEVKDTAATTDGVVVTAGISGNFPGSPIDLRYSFTLDRNKITRLDIR